MVQLLYPILSDSLFIPSFTKVEKLITESFLFSNLPRSLQKNVLGCIISVTLATALRAGPALRSTRHGAPELSNQRRDYTPSSCSLDALMTLYKGGVVGFLENPGAHCTNLATLGAQHLLWARASSRDHRYHTIDNAIGKASFC